MITPRICVRLEAKSDNLHGHVGSMRVKATKQHPQNLCTYRQHGTWPFPQLPWPAAMIGIRVALPCAEEMFAMRLALIGWK